MHGRAPPANRVLQVGLTHRQPLLQSPGVVGQQYFVQASSKLIGWTVIGTATDLGDGTFEFADPEWTNYAAR
jgi:hypothetical protein